MKVAVSKLDAYPNAMANNYRTLVCTLLLSLGSMVQAQQIADPPTSFYFDFGDGEPEAGYTKILPTTIYTPEVGYGFLSNVTLRSVNNNDDENKLTQDFITADEPFYFSVSLPEGNYDVTIYLGDKKGTSTTTVRAECRRLMIPVVTTKKGEVIRKHFKIHIRNARIANQDSIKLKPRELHYFHWDNQLTLEFNGKQPKVCGMQIKPASTAVTIFLAGNSTVVDQAEEPYAAWGQMLPVFFKPDKVVVANYAESGETLRAFKRERRLEKILSLVKPGDYLFIEFAHNDQKPGGNFLDPFTTYKEMLKEYIAAARQKGAQPILVTSMHRRHFDSDGHIANTLGDYPEAMRQTGKEENVAVIDLHAVSKILFEAWGPELSMKAFVHYPAGTFSNQTVALKDDTHFSPYGAYQLARCVVEEIKRADPDLARELIDDLPSFDPASPPPPDKWIWPLSPVRK